MKSASLWIIRIALTVQFVGVLAVPAIVAAGESPRGTWMGEWLRPHSIERTIGVLRLRETKLTFVEQVGQVDWQIDLARVKKIATVNGGRSLLIVSQNGDEYVVSIMETNLTPVPAKNVSALIEHAMQLVLSERGFGPAGTTRVEGSQMAGSR